MCQASLAFSLMVFAVKIATASLPAFEVVFFRSLLGMLMTGALMVRKKVSFSGKPAHRKLLVLRGVSGFCALSLHFYTITLLPLGTAVMLNYTAIIFVALFAIILLGEKPGAFLISMILTSFIGVYLLVKPELSLSLVVKRHFDETLIPLLSAGFAVFLGILSAIFAAVAVMTIRRVGNRESPLTLIFYFTAISTVGSLFLLPFGFSWPRLEEWFALILIAVGSFYGQIWATIAYRRAPASLVAPFAYLTPLLAFLYGLLFWKERLAFLGLLGALLILLAGVSISVREASRGRPSLTTT